MERLPAALSATACRYFTSYSGVKLPLRLVDERSESEIRNRNTFFRGYFNSAGQMLACEKVVYNETEFRHVYCYADEGHLLRAEVDDGSGDVQVIDYSG